MNVRESMSAQSATNEGAISVRPQPWGLGLTFTLCGAILWHFHDRFWWGPDEGAYSYVAERINAGDRYALDITDIHPGVVHWIHSVAFRLFGEQLVSMRYFLTFGFLMAAVAIHIVVERRHGPAVGTSTAVAFTSLSFVLFLNPNANWYCLLALLALGTLLTRVPPSVSWRLPVLGAGIAGILLLRQLSGVIAAIAIVAVLLSESTAPTKEESKASPFARSLPVLLIFGLLWYLVTRTNGSAIGLFGSWVVVYLLAILVRLDLTSGEIRTMVGGLTKGFAAVLVPAVGAQLVRGTLTGWLDSVVGSANGLSQQDWIGEQSFANLLVLGIAGVVRFESVASITNGGFWIVLTLAPAALAWRATTATLAGRSVPPFVTLAVVWSVVSLHYQIPVYLFFSSGLTLVGHVLITDSSNRQMRGAFVVFTALLAAIALTFHAAQPLTRPLVDVVMGERLALVEDTQLGTGLWLPADDLVTYTKLVDLIKTNSDAEDPILTLPTNPELYTLSKRSSPLWFFNTTFGLRSEADVLDAIAALQANPPAVVVHRSDDKYRTSESDRLLASSTQGYDLIAEFDGFEVYARPKASAG